MTASNHALTGALIAVTVKQPALGLCLAFLAHFAMDAIPHFGLKIDDVFKRNNSAKFRRVLALDVVLSAILLITIPLLLADSFNPIYVFLAMFLCMSPDLVWGYRFYGELKTKKEKQKSFFSKFHNWIQWSESPSGIFVEIVWFFAVLLLLIVKS